MTLPPSSSLPSSDSNQTNVFNIVSVMSMVAFSCQDGMDQSKWSLPRARHGIVTKPLAKHERVRTKVQGAWFHQICFCLYCLDVRQSSDASMATICAERGVSPRRKILVMVSWMRFLNEQFAYCSCLRRQVNQTHSKPP